MSFRIYASGSHGYRYPELNNCMEGSDFDAVQVINLLQGMEPSLRGSGTLLERVARGAIGPVGEIVTPSVNIIEAAGGLAQRVFLDLIVTGVSLLAIQTNSGCGSISVYSNVSHLIWPVNYHTATLATYNFSPMDFPGTEFARAVLPSLAENNMQNWGVLRQLAIVINEFSGWDNEGATPRLLIQLSK